MYIRLWNEAAEWRVREKGGGGEALVHRAIIHTTIGTKTRIMATRNQFIEVEYEFILFNCGFPNKQKTKFLSQISNIYLHTTIPLGYWKTCWSKKRTQQHLKLVPEIMRIPWRGNYSSKIKHVNPTTIVPAPGNQWLLLSSKSTISFNEIFLSHFITLWFLLRSAFRISSNSHLIR